MLHGKRRDAERADPWCGCVVEHWGLVGDGRVCELYGRSVPDRIGGGIRFEYGAVVLLLDLVPLLPKTDGFECGTDRFSTCW